jgi:hypothetical protein
VELAAAGARAACFLPFERPSLGGSASAAAGTSRSATPIAKYFRFMIDSFADE